MTFEEWLAELRVHAMNSAAETRQIAADSWGSGYDTGYSDALEHVAAHFPSPARTGNTMTETGRAILANLAAMAGIGFVVFAIFVIVKALFK